MQNNLIEYQSLLLKMVGEIEDYAVFFLDVEGNVGSWNKGAEIIKGYSAADIIGSSFRKFYTQESLENRVPEQFLEEAKLKGKAEQIGWRLRKDGRTFWAHVTLKALYDDDNILIGFSKMTKDLTEKMKAEKEARDYARELEFKNKELEQFVYIASHDLQEPLITVRNFVDLIRSEYSGQMDEEMEVYLNYIYQSTERMKSLIKGLLDYARLGANQPKKLVNCNSLIHALKSDLYSQIEASGASIHYQNLPVLYGYETALRQLFQNLLSNSLKFRKPDVKPEIYISAVNLGEYWKFEVRDNGIGIEERFCKKIFAIFQRLHSNSDYEGHGIGLTHCKKIVELHNGEIYVTSVPGEGSRFCFTLRIQ